ncbi:MAG: pyridoxamine 5'-phosphate oxidase family protein [Candidatus Geothermarchaeales archaeon]
MDKATRKGDGDLPAEILWLLEESYFGYVATSDLNRVPHVTPVIFVYDGHNVFFSTSRVSKKIKNIRENERVAFLIDIRDPTDVSNNRAVLIQGRAKIIGLVRGLFQYHRLSRVRSMFSEKYPKYMEVYRVENSRLPRNWRMTPFLSRLLVRIDMEKTLYWRGGRMVRLPKASKG